MSKEVVWITWCFLIIFAVAEITDSKTLNRSTDVQGIYTTGNKIEKQSFITQKGIFTENKINGQPNVVEESAIIGNRIEDEPIIAQENSITGNRIEDEPIIAQEISLAGNRIEDEPTVVQKASEAKSKIIDEPIVCNIDYRNYRTMEADWSSTVEYNEDQGLYFLVDYNLVHAHSFSEFCDRYPTVTIETGGEAKSDSTFGDVGQGQFGTKTYDTKYFMSEKFVYMVDASKSMFWTFDVSAKIGIGFQKTDTNLFLHPVLTGSLTSVGAYTRQLDIGLSINKATFNPKNGYIVL